MGKLAWAGAIAGAGKGISDSAALRQETEARKEEIDFTAKKEQQLARLRGSIETDLAHTRGDIQKDVQTEVTELQQDRIAERERKADERAASQAVLNREHESGEGEKDRESRLEIAKIGAAARTGASKPDERFKFSTANGGQASGWADVGRVTDKSTGTTFIQKGNKFELENWEPPEGYSEPDAGVEEALFEAMKEDGEAPMYGFADTYGYVPGWAFRALSPWYSASSE